MCISWDEIEFAFCRKRGLDCLVHPGHLHTRANMTARRIIVISAGVQALVQFILFMCIQFFLSCERSSKSLSKVSAQFPGPHSILAKLSVFNFQKPCFYNLYELRDSVNLTILAAQLARKPFKLSDLKLDVCPSQKCTRSFEFPIQMSNKKTISSRLKSLEDTIQSYCWPIKDIFTVLRALSRYVYLSKDIWERWFFSFHCGQNIWE